MKGGFQTLRKNLTDSGMFVSILFLSSCEHTPGTPPKKNTRGQCPLSVAVEATKEGHAKEATKEGHAKKKSDVKNSDGVNAKKKKVATHKPLLSRLERPRITSDTNCGFRTDTTIRNASKLMRKKTHMCQPQKTSSNAQTKT